VLIGPGLWPGPCRQARWAGRRLRRSRVGPEDRFCEAVENDLQVPLTLEGSASPDNARHTGPGPVTRSRRSAHPARCLCPGRSSRAISAAVHYQAAIDSERFSVPKLLNHAARRLRSCSGTLASLEIDPWRMPPTSSSGESSTRGTFGSRRHSRCIMYRLRSAHQASRSAERCGKTAFKAPYARPAITQATRAHHGAPIIARAPALQVPVRVHSVCLVPGGRSGAW
jgi:hypothetical protein